MIARAEKNKILHTNYSKNIDRFNLAIEKDSQIEAMMILYSMFEQVTSNLIVRLASLDSEYSEFIRRKIERKHTINLRQKIQILKTLISDYQPVMVDIFKGDEGIDELLRTLDHINRHHDERNTVAHNLMLDCLDYDELREINKCLRNDFRILNKNQTRLKSYITQNGIDTDVSCIVIKLEKTKI